MSYILDALKKIEHEKNKKAHPDGRLSISDDLFQERKRPAARAGIWKIVALIVAASLLTCAGTWFALQAKGKKGSAVIHQAAPLPVTPVIPVAVQSPPVPAASLPAAVPVVQRNTETGADDDSSAREVRRSKQQIKPPQPLTLKQPAQTMQAPADIKLSGIAWQDERTARRAVVNGFLLKEGAVVSGAKITDIQADRVRFSSASGLFEIKLDAVLPADVQR